MDEIDFDVRKFRNKIQHFLTKTIAVCFAYSGAVERWENFDFTINNYKIKSRNKNPDYGDRFNLLIVKHAKKKIFVCKWEIDYHNNNIVIKEVITLDNENLEHLRNMFDLVVQNVEELGLEDI
jgi:hypothetical protein